MGTQIDNGTPQLPVLDDTPVEIRHIVAAEPGTVGAVEVLPGAWWAPAAGDGLSGDDGWVSASIERRVLDSSQLQGLVLPNAAGADGILHRDRFSVRTDPAARMGDEWLEFTDEVSGEPFGVVTPETARVDRTTVNVSGPDAAGLLSGFREGKVAPWTPHAPQDVVDWYSRAPQQPIADDLRDSAPTTGWSGAATPGVDGLHVTNGNTIRTLPRATERGAAWTVSATVVIPQGALCVMRVRNAAGDTVAQLELQILNTGQYLLTFTSRRTSSSGTTVQPTFTGQGVGAPIELQLFALDGWFILTCDGSACAQLRREGTAADPIKTVRLDHSGPGALVVSRADVRATASFLRRGAPAPDYRVAGAPTPGGLRGDYFLTYDEWVRSGPNFTDYGAMVPSPLAEPYQRRLDPAINFGGASWMPPGPPNGEGFAVRWSGSIYLGLADQDISLRLQGIDDMARVWVGKTSAADPYIDAWGVSAAGVAYPAYGLRAHLGQADSGWYPIVIEYANGPGFGGIIMEALYSTAPTTWYGFDSQYLSPYGCFEGDLGGESHRSAIDSVCTASGLRWRIQPKTLESGEFPGQLDVGARLGRDTDYILGEDEATEYASEVRVADVIDHITADAQGLGDNLGREGLTATIIDPSVVDRPWVLTRSETLTDITEQTLLQQRLSTLLALYGSPGEEISARPRGVRMLTDSFPTTGAAQVFRWEPDDGIRVRLPTVGVDDQTPRALTAVTWQLTPRGRTPPPVGFRQRPRHLRETLKRLQRGVALQRRRYQGQLAERPGSIGSNLPQAATDEYSRVGLPIGGVAKVVVVVSYIAGSGTLQVCGTDTGLAITRPGTYDVTAYVPTGTIYGYAQLAGSGYSVILQMVATVRI
jgi:hypothetical protein